MNLALLSKAERDAIEQDKRRWFKAYQMLQQMSVPQIRAELDRMPDEEREDMRRRLNQMRRKQANPQ